MKIFILIMFLLATVRTMAGFVKTVNEDEDVFTVFASLLVMITTMLAYYYLCQEFLTLK